MATTTTNFGWDIPQSTDYVKDGATAIAALGQDIDTSMYELKGGTTGQFLTKTSNTDMDFTWAGSAITYTPTWGVTSGTAPTIGNGSLAGRYVRVGDLIYFSIKVTLGSTTTVGSGIYTLSLPVAMGANERGISGYAQVLDAGVAWYRGFFPITVENAYTDKFTMVSAAGVSIANNSPISFGNADNIYVWGSYSV